jgi:hypothetical protein
VPRFRTILAALLLAVAGFTLYVVGQDHPLDRPCPQGSRTAQPTEIHLYPAILQHQSWVGIPPSEIADGQVLYICTGGTAIGRAVMDPIDVASDVVALDVPTRWVDMTWASGQLDRYQDPDRWQIVFPPFAGGVE